MELKLGRREWGKCKKLQLLIVPYGIETGMRMFWLCHQFLLIVPYGIETMSFCMLGWLQHLLIVPYGIETPNTLDMRPFGKYF